MMSNYDPSYTPGGYDEPYADAKQPTTDEQPQSGTQNSGYQPDTAQHTADNSRASPSYPQASAPPPQQPHQNPATVEAPVPSQEAQSSVTCPIDVNMSMEVVTKITKAVCFLVMMICTSVGYAELKDAYGDLLRTQASIVEAIEYGISAGVIGFVLEVITIILHMMKILSTIANPRPPILMMIFNIVSLILFFTSVLPLVHAIYGKEVAAYTAFAIFGTMAGTLEFYKQITTLRGGSNQASK